MNTLEILADIEGRSPFRPDQVTRGYIVQIGGMPHGMTSGRTSIGISVQLDDGRGVYAETSLRLFMQAAIVLASNYRAETRDSILAIDLAAGQHPVHVAKGKLADMRARWGRRLSQDVASELLADLDAVLEILDELPSGS